MANYKKLVSFILKWEGGYSNNDGYPTMKGVRLDTFRAVYGKSKTVKDLKNITTEQWEYIFKTYYWDKCKADAIEAENVAFALVDWYWNSGKWAVKRTQRLVGVSDDGIVGSYTINAINAAGSGLFAKINNSRRSYYNSLANKNASKYWKFLKGWLNRVEDLEETYG